MQSPSSKPETAVQGSSGAEPAREASGVPIPARQSAADLNRAAQGPIPEPVSAAANPLPPSPAASTAWTEGRRILSRAVVLMGSDRHITVELRDGRVLVLRDVVVRPKDYCGVQVLGGAAKAKHCGGFAQIVAARPGGVPPQPDPAATQAPGLPHDPAKRD